MKNVAVTPGQQLFVTVGAGGSGGWEDTSYDYYMDGYDGSASSVGEICSAAGGKGGQSSNNNYGGNGGSAGGNGSSMESSQFSNRTNYNSYVGAKDGNDGYDYDPSITYNTISKGQGTTTRYFGESTGTLYSTGGCGGGAKNGWYGARNANTGDGGSRCTYNAYPGVLGDGGSGICIIRWTKDYFK